jgi:hypothetical protein
MTDAGTHRLGDSFHVIGAGPVGLLLTAVRP